MVLQRPSTILKCYSSSPQRKSYCSSLPHYFIISFSIMQTPFSLSNLSFIFIIILSPFLSISHCKISAHSHQIASKNHKSHNSNRTPKSQPILIKSHRKITNHATQNRTARARIARRLRLLYISVRIMASGGLYSSMWVCFLGELNQILYGCLTGIMVTICWCQSWVVAGVVVVIVWVWLCVLELELWW